ncbi:hypothetical protein C5D34_08210 [Rathayibacter sp. AY1B1]|nr:hypothetical protein C5D08_01645 [Rathayibacter sp. AY1B6]PPI34827.1 hypothetical protein C5D34_08210 [Rathayibacter sp. AY1B1]
MRRCCRSRGPWAGGSSCSECWCRRRSARRCTCGCGGGGRRGRCSGGGGSAGCGSRRGGRRPTRACRPHGTRWRRG